MWALIEYDDNIKFDRMCEIIIRWRGSGANLSNFKSVAELGYIANFVKDTPKWKPKRGANNNKSRQSEKYVELRRCLVCDQQGHLVIDCKDPRKENWIKNRQKRDVKNSVRGRSRERNPRERSRERSSSWDRGSNRDRDRRAPSRERSRDRDRSVDRSNFDMSKKSSKA